MGPPVASLLHGRSTAAAAADAPPHRLLLTDDDVQILALALASLREGQGTALVTLTHIRGGAARALGAHMMVRADGGYAGFVSGGCVEAAVALEAVQAIQAGQDRTCIYGDGSPYFDVVLPCGGGITLAVHVLHDPGPLVQVLAALEARRAVATRYSPATQQLAVHPATTATGNTGAGFVRQYRPRTRLVVFARSIELAALTQLAGAVGYEVIAGEPLRPGELARQVDEDTAVLFLYHDLDLERPALMEALRCQPFHIGALGSRRTHHMRMAGLRQHGCTDHEIARIKAPIGLFPKARDARSLALSILADIAALRSP